MTRSAPSCSGSTWPPASVSAAVSFSRCWGSVSGVRTRAKSAELCEMKSRTLMSASSWPRPITMRWSAVSGHLAHEVGGDEDGPALGGQRLHQVPHPEDALGVEAVDRLVEEQHLGVAEERGGDSEPLAHAEREALGALFRHVLEADDTQHLVHAAGRDTGQLGEAQEVVAGVPATVHGLGVEERADLAGGVGQLAVGVAADRDLTGAGVVEPEDHAHGRRLARPVGPEETGDGTRPYLEGKVVHGCLVAVALRQADCLDHSPHPSNGSGRRGTRPRKG